jgi:hypothetical protein
MVIAMAEREKETPSTDPFSMELEEILRWIPHELLLPRETYRALSTIPGQNITLRSCVSFPGNHEGRFAARQRAIDLANTLASLKAKGVVRNEDVEEVLLQHAIVEQRRFELLQHLGEVVVACNGELFYGRSLEEAIKKAKEKYGDKPYYSETIGIVNFPSPL